VLTTKAEVTVSRRKPHKRKKTSDRPCQQNAAEGKPCGNNAQIGSDYCYAHEPKDDEPVVQPLTEVSVSAREIDSLTRNVTAASAMEGSWRTCTAIVMKLRIAMEEAEEAGRPANEIRELRRLLGDWTERNSRVLNTYLKSGIRERYADDNRRTAEAYIKLLEAFISHLHLSSDQQARVPSAITAALQAASIGGGEQELGGSPNGGGHES
jgi:hypothetical protein